MGNSVIENIRSSLSRTTPTLLGSRPDIYPARQPEPLEAEKAQFIRELTKLQAVGRQAYPSDLSILMKELVAEQKVHKATLWNTDLLQKLDLAGLLQALNVELVTPTADKSELALCDLGITEADFLLAETGTVVLRSSAAKPRAVSLLPPTHLVIASPLAFRPDMHQVFAEARKDPYLVFVTGASRTADIELVTTLGVHGPKNLYVWLMEP